MVNLIRLTNLNELLLTSANQTEYAKYIEQIRKSKSI
jgi:hypothetical protein